MSRTAIVLAAHGAGDGSAANEQIARLAKQVEQRLKGVHVPEVRATQVAQVRAVRATQVAQVRAVQGAQGCVADGLSCSDNRVLAAFNLGAPRFPDVLDLTDATRIIVVPLMTSAGYFASTVLPQQLRRHPRSSAVEWRFTEPVGMHPLIEDAGFDQMTAVVGGLALDPARTIGVVVGHGTTRHAASRDATVGLASRLARRRGVRSCIAAFLDEDPRIEDVPALLPGDHLVILPFLIGGGYHALTDIPIRLHMDAPQDEGGAFPLAARANGRTIVCTAALGASPRLVDAVMDLIERAEADQPVSRDFHVAESGVWSASNLPAIAVSPATQRAPDDAPSLMRLGTRRSALALWQARHVADRLAARGLPVRLVDMTTSGDRDLTKSIADLGGDAPFTDDLDQALREHRIDLAVHSLKDMPLRVPDDLAIAAILPRGDVGESLVSHRNLKLKELPAGGIVGTSSPRRAAQLLSVRPDLRPTVIRGPVDDRVRQVRAGRFDAAILATAGLRRLGQMQDVTEELPLVDFLPAPGQGAMAVVVRAGDATLLRDLASLDHADTRRATTSELELLRWFERRADVTVAAYAQVIPSGGGLLHLTARVLTPRGRVVWEETLTGDDPMLLGRRAAAEAECTLDIEEARAT